MKALYFILIFLLPLSASGQEQAYIIRGKLKQPIDGIVYLFSDVIEKKYYGNNPVLDSAKLSKGIFFFKRRAHPKAWPVPYKLAIKSGSFQVTTGMILIEQKNQIILIDSISNNLAPVMPNSLFQDELKNQYQVFFKPFVVRAKILANYIDSLYSSGKTVPQEVIQKIVQMQTLQSMEGDSLFYNYAKMHPDSKVTLWKLIERFSNLGYKNIYWDIFELLKGNVKKSAPAQFLMTDLKVARFLAIGNVFPIVKLKDTSGKPILFDARKFQSKYTLIDFWFSNCAPCLREFPLYKQVYFQYNKLGFNIIGISIDNKKDIPKWKDIIKKQTLLWSQYLDEDGKLSKEFFINTFPTNFLIDEKGIIIKKNISKNELEELLLKL